MGDVLEWRYIRVQVNEHVILTLGDLVDGWSAHVRRLIVEQDASAHDHSVWGAHDYVAAMYLRDALARGTDGLATAFRNGTQAGIDIADRLFIDSTVSDELGVVRRFAGVDAANAGWWWSRLPPISPVRAELDEWGPPDSQAERIGYEKFEIAEMAGPHIRIRTRVP